MLKVIMSSQLVLALLTVGGAWWAVNNLNGNIAAGEDIVHPEGVEKVSVEGPQEPLNVLVLGSDSRDGSGNDIDGLAGGGQRSDTTILLHVSADRKTTYGVSLPRDAIIDRPDCTMPGGDVVPGEDAVMFNTAFSVGGAQCASQTVQDLTGVYIDHFLVLDFNGFKDMVDAVNGVEVCIPREVDDPAHDIFFDAGTQNLTGQDALNYVRERYVLSATGDIGRMKRQQAFIASMTSKVLSAGTLSQPTRVYSFLSAATKSIQVDSQLDSVGKLAGLATQFKDTGLSGIKFITVPIAEYPLDPNRLIWTDEADALWKKIQQDRALGKQFSEGSIRADDPIGSTDAPSDQPTDEPSEEFSAAPTDEPSGQADSDKQLSESEIEERMAAGLCV